jgi:quinol monooxygenase YgiN
MIIVSGRIYVEPEQRNSFLSASLNAIKQAREAPGCLDFVVAADPIEPHRVNVYEAWESEAVLEASRGSGPDDDLSSMIVRADIARHQIASSGPP